MFKINFFYILILLAGCAHFFPKQNRKIASSEKFCDKVLAEIKFEVPGLSYVYLENGEVKHEGGCGHIGGYSSDKMQEVSNHGLPATNKTIWPVQSVSKLITVLTTLQALEKLALKKDPSNPLLALNQLLDQDINKLFRFNSHRIQNPHFPNQKITMRHVLTHTSSIINNYNSYPHNKIVKEPNYVLQEPAYNETMWEYLNPKGQAYSTKNFLTKGPGHNYKYSSIASSIAALLIPYRMGTNFKYWSQINLFDSLKMWNTGWRYRDLTYLKDRGNFAYPMMNNKAGNWTRSNACNESIRKEVFCLFWEHLFYPSASLKSTTSDFAHLLKMLMNDGRYNGQQILQSETLLEMTKDNQLRNFPTWKDVRRNLPIYQGLIVSWQKYLGIWYVCHQGYNPGFWSIACYRPKKHYSVNGKLSDNSKEKRRGFAIFSHDFKGSSKELIESLLKFTK